MRSRRRDIVGHSAAAPARNTTFLSHQPLYLTARTLPALPSAQPLDHADTVARSRPAGKPLAGLAGPTGLNTYRAVLARASSADEARDVSSLDGLPSILADAWVLLHTSGTQPLIRVIVEVESEARLHGLLAAGSALVTEALPATAAY